jgi:hypothetical protein
MNLSLIMRFLTADMTGRIASALGFDHTAKRSMLIACSAICLGLAFPTSSFAQRKALATCEMEWSANKAFNQAAGITKGIGWRNAEPIVQRNWQTRDGQNMRANDPAQRTGRLLKQRAG